MASHQPVTSAFSSPERQLVCIVGSHDGGEVDAQIAVCVFNASITPQQPRLLVVLWKTNRTRDLVEASGSLCLSLLGRGGLALIEALGMRSGERSLEGLPARLTAAGDPYFEGCVAYAECAVTGTLDLGDATAFAVGVRAEHALAPGETLTWQHAMEHLDEDFLRRYNEQFERDQQFALAHMKWL